MCMFSLRSLQYLTVKCVPVLPQIPAVPHCEVCAGSPSDLCITPLSSVCLFSLRPLQYLTVSVCLFSLRSLQYLTVKCVPVLPQILAVPHCQAEIDCPAHDGFNGGNYFIYFIGR